MTALALENLLQDFGKRARASDRDLDPTTLSHVVTSRNEPDISQEMLETEIARAEGALRERMQVEHETALELEHRRHAGEVAELNARLGGVAGALLAERLGAMEESIVQLTTSVTARILAVHLTAEVQNRMIGGLGQAIREALRDTEAVRIRVRGPLSLYEALAASVGDLSRHLEFVEAPGFDLSASIDDSLFETRLADWSAALAEAVS